MLNEAEYYMGKEDQTNHNISPEELGDEANWVMDEAERIRKITPRPVSSYVASEANLAAWKLMLLIDDDGNRLPQEFVMPKWSGYSEELRRSHGKMPDQYE